MIPYRGIRNSVTITGPAERNAAAAGERADLELWGRLTVALNSRLPSSYARAHVRIVQPRETTGEAFAERDWDVEPR
jgi:hypothetical protein